MNVVLHDGYSATIHISRRTWIKIACLLAIAVGGHVKLQWDMNTRLKTTEKTVCELKKDCRDTNKELRADIRELMSLLIESKTKNMVESLP